MRVGITINQKKEKAPKTTYAFRNILRIFLKTGKKRLLVTILTGTLIFLALTLLFTTWFSYRYNFFFNYMDTNYNWRNDFRISYVDSEEKSTAIDLPSFYFSLQINHNRGILDSLIPDVSSNFTAALSSQLYTLTNETEEIWFDNNLMTFDNNSQVSLTHALVEGRMPTNTSEIIYHRQNATSPIAINDTIPFYGERYDSDTIRNFTVVGIVENLENFFYIDGFSSDILGRPDNYWGDYHFIYFDEMFYTTNDLFLDALSEFPDYNGVFSFLIDFNYQLTAAHVRDINQYLRNFRDFRDYYYIYNFCDDLHYALRGFYNNWSFETARVFSSSIPIIFLFGLVSIESLKIGNHELVSKFRLMKIQGVETKSIRRLVSLENLTISSVSFFGGSILGFFIGYFVFLGMGNTSFSDYSLSIVEPVIFIVLVALYLTLFVGGFLLENSLAKKTEKLTAVRYKTERKKKWIRRIFTAQETLMFLPGIGFIAVGLTGQFILPLFPIDYLSNLILQFELAFMFLMAIGGLFILSSVFLLLARFISMFWSFLGKRVWKTTKSYFTLTLKHLSIYSRNYQRIILVVFMIGLGITPGLILKKSVNNHTSVEAKLYTGYSDLLISNWQPFYEPIYDNITNTEGIEKVTKLSVYHFQDYNGFELSSKNYMITIASIQNTTDFLQVVDSELFNHTVYTKDDILELQTNMTYMMNTKYVKENKYDKGKNFTSAILTRAYALPYNMTYVNSFDIFPLVARTDSYVYGRWFETFSIITSELTALQILNRTSSSSYLDYNHYLLIKLSTGANVTQVRYDLISKYGLLTQTSGEVETLIKANISTFGLNYFTIATIVTIVIAIFYGFITARNIYNERLRIIESEYQIGAKKRQIWVGFTIELILIIIIPLVLSFAATIPILNSVSGPLLNVHQVYLKFIPWLPWWLTIIIVLLCYVTLVGGWLLEMIPSVRKYRPIKQE
ncbi:MAG: ABC transporter permease [Candidatus Heimdallarchaeota archaeon]|nr:ABC transporter permease [Candidatus Heimdallarchaeota archaeon]MCK5297307.1 ABC transporter permease [Candidatus Heimdallarchaeota archaeon]